MCSAHCDKMARKTCTLTGVITAVTTISRLVLPFSRDAPDAANGKDLHPAAGGYLLIGRHEKEQTFSQPSAK